MPFHREDVDVDALLFPDAVVVGVFKHSGTTITYLGVEEEVVGVGVAILQGEPVREFSGEHLHKPQVVGTHHLDVKVVVPGDEAAMTEGSDEGAAAEPVADVVLLADAVYLEQDVEHTELEMAQLGTIGIETCAKQLRVAPCHDFVDGGSGHSLLPCEVLYDLESVGEVFGEVAALEVGHETSFDGFHGGKDALEGFNGMEFPSERGGIVTLVIIKNGR